LLELRPVVNALRGELVSQPVSQSVIPPIIQLVSRLVFQPVSLPVFQLGLLQRARPASRTFRS
jgi:hypothetical protein